MTEFQVGLVVSISSLVVGILGLLIEKHSARRKLVGWLVYAVALIGIGYGACLVQQGIVLPKTFIASYSSGSPETSIRYHDKPTADDVIKILADHRDEPVVMASALRDYIGLPVRWKLTVVDGGLSGRPGTLSLQLAAGGMPPVIICDATTPKGMKMFRDGDTIEVDGIIESIAIDRIVLRDAAIVSE
jgi:hypothetical protein